MRHFILNRHTITITFLLKKKMMVCLKMMFIIIDAIFTLSHGLGIFHNLTDNNNNVVNCVTFILKCL